MQTACSCMQLQGYMQAHESYLKMRVCCLDHRITVPEQSLIDSLGRASTAPCLRIGRVSENLSNWFATECYSAPRLELNLGPSNWFHSTSSSTTIRSHTTKNKFVLRRTSKPWVAVRSPSSTCAFQWQQSTHSRYTTLNLFCSPCFIHARECPVTTRLNCLHIPSDIPTNPSIECPTS